MHQFARFNAYYPPDSPPSPRGPLCTCTRSMREIQGGISGHKDNLRIYLDPQSLYVVDGVDDVVGDEVAACRARLVVMRVRPDSHLHACASIQLPPQQSKVYQKRKYKLPRLESDRLPICNTGLCAPLLQVVSLAARVMKDDRLF
jgi:hypothetical protein